MAEFDKVIKGGTIVDGTLTPPFKADVGIKDGRITKVGYLKSSDAKQTLDASGLIVAPGAIDLHCHYDAPGVLGSGLLDRKLARRYLRHQRQLRLRLCPRPS